MIMNSCPVCGQELQVVDTKKDRNILLELIQECPLGHYIYHFNCGIYKVTIKGKEFTWDFNTPGKIVVGEKEFTWDHITSRKGYEITRALIMDAIIDQVLSKEDK